MFTEEKPSLDDTIEHFGVKGMQWGVRKRARGPEIRAARRSVRNSRENMQDARREVRKAKTSTERVAATKKFNEQKMAFLTNPDRATAARLTRGEHIAAFLLLTPATAIGLSAGVQLHSRAIEAKQFNNDYAKKK